VIEHKLVESRVIEKNGVQVGVIEGYIATWDEDTGGKYGIPDQFVRGAFAKSLAEHRARGNRPIRLKDMHGQTIGGFPIETAREDERGLRAVGEINLGTERGREVYSLVKQGVLTDLSIGFISVKERLDPGRKRMIDEAIIMEPSVVDEPANRAARILSVKSGEARLSDILEDLVATTKILSVESRGAPVRTSIDDDDHVHEIFVPDGVVPAGSYATSVVNGHAHSVWLDRPLAPGQSVELVTTGPSAGDFHAHNVSISVVQERAEPDHELSEILQNLVAATKSLRGQRLDSESLPTRLRPSRSSSALAPIMIDLRRIRNALRRAA